MHMQDDRENRTIIQGLGSVAVTLAQMGISEPEAKSQLIAWVSALHVDTSQAAEVLRKASASAASLPRTPDDPPHKAEHRQRIRQMLDLPEPAEDRANTARACQWLLSLADEIDRALDA